VTAVVPARAPALEGSPLAAIQIGDLEDLENSARAEGAELVLGNSHALQPAKRLGVPLLRVGFPQYDLIGGFQRCWCGYRGTTQALFDMANLLVENHQGIPPHHSIYAQKPATEQPQWRH
jgi:nitrogenase molybdenum-iron protein NifN